MEPIRVLAVAHDETTFRLCLLGLHVEGMDVVHAIGLDTALDIAEARRPDAIVLDTTIPTVSGLGGLRRVVDDPVTAGIPVITLVGHDDPGARMAHWIAGAASTIAKPFSLDVLSHTVRRFARMGPAHLAAFRDDVLGRLRDLGRSPSAN